MEFYSLILLNCEHSLAQELKQKDITDKKITLFECTKYDELIQIINQSKKAVIITDKLSTLGEIFKIENKSTITKISVLIIDLNYAISNQHVQNLRNQKIEVFNLIQDSKLKEFLNKITST